jgi:hypothetical protein
MMSGHVEADETFIGGKARNMHKDVRVRKITGTGGKDKTMVMGILERGKDGKQSKVRTTVVSNRKKKALQSEVRKHVEAGSPFYNRCARILQGAYLWAASNLAPARLALARYFLKTNQLPQGITAAAFRIGSGYYILLPMTYGRPTGMLGTCISPVSQQYSGD